MTKFSRILTIAVTVLAVLFMGVSLVMTATRTDWKDAATKKYPKAEIGKQLERIKELDERIAAFDAAKVRARETIAIDEKSITDPAAGRWVELEKLAADLTVKAHELAQQTEAQALKTNAKLDELKLRREDTVRLQNQYEELVSDTTAAQAESKRLRDLLFQAKVVLERLERRLQALEEQIGKTKELP